MKKNTAKTVAIILWDEELDSLRKNGVAYFRQVIVPALGDKAEFIKNYIHEEGRFLIPQYHIGDRLALKETYRIEEGVYIFRSDEAACGKSASYLPPATLPPQETRYFAEVTGIWAERVQSIKKDELPGCTLQEYQERWNEYVKTHVRSIPRKKVMEGYSWDANPWTWVTQMRLISN